MVLRIILTSYFLFQIVVIHSLLDAKITNVLFLCHNKTILVAVQSIIKNMISCEDTSQQQVHFLQVC